MLHGTTISLSEKLRGGSNFVSSLVNRLKTGVSGLGEAAKNIFSLPERNKLFTRPLPENLPLTTEVPLEYSSNKVELPIGGDTAVWKQAPGKWEMFKMRLGDKINKLLPMRDDMAQAAIKKDILKSYRLTDMAESVVRNFWDINEHKMAKYDEMLPGLYVDREKYNKNLSEKAKTPSDQWKALNSQMMPGVYLPLDRKIVYTDPSSRTIFHEILHDFWTNQNFFLEKPFYIDAFDTAWKNLLEKNNPKPEEARVIEYMKAIDDFLMEDRDYSQMDFDHFNSERYAKFGAEVGKYGLGEMPGELRSFYDEILY